MYNAEACHKHYLKHKAERNAKGKIYYANNKEKFKELHQVWLLKNKERIKETSAIWRSKNRERLSKINSVWHAKNKERRNELTRRNGRSRRDKAIQIIMDAHGLQGCHVSIHPNMPNDLRSRLCWGPITLEHPEGQRKTGKEGSEQAVSKIVKGLCDPKDYMVLCQLHQIWNIGNWRERS